MRSGLQTGHKNETTGQDVRECYNIVKEKPKDGNNNLHGQQATEAMLRAWRPQPSWGLILAGAKPFS